MTIISGVLRDALGNPINGSLTLRAKRTTSNVFQDTHIRVETANGKYSLNLQPCEYDVVLAVDGYNKNNLGTIQILADTPNGSLNDLLINPNTGELVTPAILQQVIEYRDQTKQIAETVDLSKFIKQGDYGIGSQIGAPITNPDDRLLSGWYGTRTSSFPDLSGNDSATLAVYGSSNKLFYVEQLYIVVSKTPKILTRCVTIDGKQVWYETITTANSTVDSNGFYKKASPIMRLFGTENINPVDGFTQSGCGLVNSLATGVTAKRVDVGHYEIHGSLGFAQEGWYITLPEDANGNKKFFAEYSFNDGVITVKTYTRKFSTKLCEIVAGDPIDITDGRWIDLRLEMSEVTASELDSAIPNDNNE